MATITGLTAERMLAIEGQSVVDGDIVGNNLILERFDGTPIDAGVVVGPQGPQGNPGAAGQGVPVGGSTGQALVKQSGTNYDTVWQSITPPVLTPVTTLPTTGLTNGMQRILTDSLTNPTYQWLCQYDTSISDANKWRVIGGGPVTAQANSNSLANGGTLVASLPAPRAGLYKAIASVFAGNGAVDPNPQLYFAGSLISDPAYAGGQYSRTYLASYMGSVLAASAGQALDAYVFANGSDNTYGQASLSLHPVRII